MAHNVRKTILGAVNRNLQKNWPQVTSTRKLLLSQGHNDPQTSNLNERNPSSESSQKIYELRTYQMRWSDFKQFLKYVEEYFPVRLKHSKLLGFWSTELGALNEVVHIWEYDNHDHRAIVRKAIANDAVWQNDFISKISPMCVIQTNATMKLLPWSSINVPRKAGVYELQIYNMNTHSDKWDSKLKAMMMLSKSSKRNSNSVLVACFKSVYGPLNTVYALWQHESFDNYIYGSLQSLCEADKSLLHNFHQDVLSGYCKGLVPHKVSPLQ
ncbi:protein NipSnap homolog 3A-like [Uloborus diversus]|uniref:protein NipSnap homolog 3A-like n=1 Tax=Uloborus diversus TaxID=327109 RepID=UPI0024091622|nr:protein NipSnap homolog 3A-like [Uloborus diversus]